MSLVDALEQIENVSTCFHQFGCRGCAPCCAPCCAMLCLESDGLGQIASVRHYWLGDSGCCCAALRCAMLCHGHESACVTRWSRLEPRAAALLLQAGVLPPEHCPCIPNRSQVGHDFFLFKDSADGDMKVLYRRR